MISRKRGLSSLESLIEDGKLTPDAAIPYRKMVEDGLSYKNLMLAELGTVLGELYCMEEEAQALVKLGLKVDLAQMSVPEILWVEDSASSEPHHLEHYSELTTRKKFEEEAAEPWHKSLLERFRPDKRVLAYFANVDHHKETKAILRIAYGIRG